MMSKTLMEVERLTKSQDERIVLADVSLSLAPGERLVIAGSTGAGKSTLLRIMSGLMQADAGRVHFEGHRVKGPDEKLMPGHPGIYYLSQHFELRKNYRVIDELDAWSRVDPGWQARVFDICRIGHLLNRMTTALSGGERQRTALARALLTGPRLLLLDEPFSNLDTAHREMMRKVIDQVCQTLGVTCLMVLHEAADILGWADRVIVLQDGRIVQDATPFELYREPVNEQAAGLLGNFDIIEEVEITRLFPGISDSGARLLIRPDSVRVIDTDKAYPSATIEHATFMGGFWLLELRWGGSLIHARVTEGHPRPGDRVGIQPCWALRIDG